MDACCSSASMDILSAAFASRSSVHVITGTMVHATVRIMVQL